MRGEGKKKSSFQLYFLGGLNDTGQEEKKKEAFSGGTSSWKRGKGEVCPPSNLCRGRSQLKCPRHEKGGRGGKEGSIFFLFYNRREKGGGKEGRKKVHAHSLDFWGTFLKTELASLL